MSRSKAIGSCLSFVLFLGLGYTLLNRAFISPNLFENSIQDFEQHTKEAPIDILFLGSSHSYTAFNPLVINQQTKAYSINLGSDALRLDFTDIILAKALETSKPKLVVLEVYPPSVKPPKLDNIKGFQLRAMDVVSNTSIRKIEIMMDHYQPEEYASVLSPLIRNHDQWNELLINPLDKTKNVKSDAYFNYYGFLGSLDTLKKNKSKFRINRPNNPIVSIDKTAFNKQTEKSLNRLIGLAEQEQVELLIVGAPSLYKHTYNSFYTYLKKYLDTKSIKFLNLNDYFNEIGLTLDDFKDPSHLNVYGAHKASHFFGQYLSDNFDFNNRSNEPLWLSIERDNKRYVDVYMSKTPLRLYQQEEDICLGGHIPIDSISAYTEGFTMNIKLKLKDLPGTDFVKFKFRISAVLVPKPGNEWEASLTNQAKGEYVDRITAHLGEFEDEIVLTTHTRILEPDEIRIFIFDANGYKGIIGDSFKISLNTTVND